MIKCDANYAVLGGELYTLPALLLLLLYIIVCMH